MIVVFLFLSMLPNDQIFAPLPLDEPVVLDPQVILDDTVSSIVSSSDLAFTVESVTRRISILGWSSQRYDLVVGEVLSGSTVDKTVCAYVFPEGFFHHQFASLEDGWGLVVIAFPDNTHEAMEGFSTSEGDWVMWIMPVAPE